MAGTHQSVPCIVHPSSDFPKPQLKYEARVLDVSGDLQNLCCILALFQRSHLCARKTQAVQTQSFHCFHHEFESTSFQRPKLEAVKNGFRSFQDIGTSQYNFKSLRFQKVLCSTPSMPSTYFNVFQQFQHLRPFASALWPPAVLNKVLAPEVTHCSPATCAVTVCDSIETPCENIANT